MEKETIDRQFIPSLREGVDIIRMIFFKKIRDFLVAKYSDLQPDFCAMAGAAVMNEIFGMPNSESKFRQFFEDNRAFLVAELEAVAVNFADFRIPLTDALRVHYLCNFQEEIDDASPEVLARAKELGILIEEREVPLPKEFMALVQRLGQTNGLLT